MNQGTDQLDAVAVIGLGLRFPDANNAAQFWSNLCSGKDSVRVFTDEQLLAADVAPASLQSHNWVKAGMLLADVELFDARFFGYTPREAEFMDPQQRLFLECGWEALEDAGYDPGRTQLRIGVFAGTGSNGYFYHNVLPNLTESRNYLQNLMMMDNDFLSTRLSYKMNLTGPSLTVQSACSTSLVATHLACQSLLNGECDMALAGGVSIQVPQISGYPYEEGGTLSSDGHCRAFDASAKGMVPGSGAGIIVLKRLTDAVKSGDSIRAVIRGSAINNDGSAKVGYMAPSVEGQSTVIAEAQALAGVSPDEISYIEAHGTGTPLGDPIEVEGLTLAFQRGTEKRGFCAIGSVKTNIGHLNTAAGIAGLIKVVLALENKMLPPSLNFKEPNPAIDFAESPFYVQQTLTSWQPETGRRIAGVSSFGIGGTNAHVIVEEAPQVTTAGESRSWKLFPMSAKSSEALENATDNLAKFLIDHADIELADVAFTLQQGRKEFECRRIVAAKTASEAAILLRTRDRNRLFSGVIKNSSPRVVFMFPGQGAQRLNMAAEIYATEKTFRDTVDFCCDSLKPHLHCDLRDVLYPRAEVSEEATARLNQTAVTQPAIFVIEYALAKLWMQWGIHPDAMIGHSIGEYTAACLAGVLSLEDAFALVAARGRLMQSMPKGSMLAVRLDVDSIRKLLGSELSLAAINGPEACVVTGSCEEIERLRQLLERKGVDSRLLSTSHAFHSHMMDPILMPFQAEFAKIKLAPPQIPFISNLTGKWITNKQATDADYWSNHLRQTVLFADGLAELLKVPDRILLEVGPGHTLAALAEQQSWQSDLQIVATFGQGKDASALGDMLTTLGWLWVCGVSHDWVGFCAGQRQHRIPLPTYPFQRQRYWIEGPRPHGNIPLDETRVGAAQESQTNVSHHEVREGQKTGGIVVPNLATRNDTELEEILVSVWREVLGFQTIGIHDDFFDLGGDSLLAMEVTSRLRTLFRMDLPGNTLFKAPTIERLAAWLLDFDGTKQRLLVEMKTGSLNRCPFFFVHASDGTEITMRPLAAAMDPDSPLYCLLARGHDGSEPFGTVEEAAVSYLEEIRRVQPHGPYYLGGYCFGGIVAFEMARVLEETGEPVAALFIIDGYNPAFLRSHLNGELMLRLTRFGIRRTILHLRKLLRLRPDMWLIYLTGRLKALCKQIVRIVSVAAQHHRVRQEGNDAGSPAVSVTSAEDLFERIKQAGPRAARKFVPKPYKGDTILFRASERSHDPYEDVWLGWKGIIKGKMESIEVEADHYGIIKPSAVGMIAKRIDQALAESTSKRTERLISRR